MVAKHMQYDNDTQFNEQNVTLYLAELEEYSSMLITYLAYKNEMPDAAVSALSLDHMVEKDKDSGPLHVIITFIFYLFIHRLRHPVLTTLTLQMMPRRRMRLSQMEKICTRDLRTLSPRTTSTSVVIIPPRITPTSAGETPVAT